MRHATLLAVAVLAAASPARAEVDDEDTYFVGFPRYTVDAGFTGHGTRIDGLTESGMGARLDLGYGRGRWQYSAEGSLESSSLQETQTTASAGRRARGALGVRWLARQFIPVDQLGVDMVLHAAGGLSSYRWMDGTSTRPDVDLGVGMAVRKFARHDIYVRLDLDLLVSRGDAGFAGGLVLGW